MNNEEFCLAAQGGEKRNDCLLELFERNRGFIYTLIKRYFGMIEEDDLWQLAFLAVIETVDHYSPDRGTFTNLLPFWVKSVVLKSLWSDAARIPDYMQQRIRKYTRLCDEYRQRTGQDPSDDYLILNLEISQDQLEDLRGIIPQQQTLSLDGEVADGLTVADGIADDRDQVGEVVDQVDRKRAARVLWSEVDKLDQRQQDAIRARYADGLTVRETALRMGLTKSQVIEATNRGCSYLRKKRKVKQAAETFGYSSNDLYGGGLQSFLRSGYSSVEYATIRKLEGFIKK